MKKLNEIDWNTIKLYHGTNYGFIRAITEKGFYIPKHNANWLGRGTYFAVNNIFLPILFSNNHAKKHKGEQGEQAEPAIIEINAEFLADYIKNTILDLTTQHGLSIFHNISNDFINFINLYDGYPELEDELRLLEKHFAASPFYHEKLKPNLVPNLNWFLLALGYQEVSEQSNVNDNQIIAELNQKGSENITNLIFDWFNFKYSSGIENDVPIRGIMAHFNSGQGTPIALANILNNQKIKRSFADYISYLNRTELSVFGYDYYGSRGSFWDFHKLFCVDKPKKGTHYQIYRGREPIKSLLKSSFELSKELGFNMDNQNINDLFNLIIGENDAH